MQYKIQNKKPRIKKNYKIINLNKNNLYNNKK